MNWNAPFPWTFIDKSFSGSFLKALGQCFSDKVSRKEWKHFCAKIHEKAKEVFAANLSELQDQQQQSHYLMTSYVLAAYLILKEDVETPRLMQALETAFASFGAFWARMGTRLGLLLSKDKLNLFIQHAESRSKEAYGKSFEIASEGNKVDFYSSNVKICGYHEFFKKNGHPDLTQETGLIFLAQPRSQRVPICAAFSFVESRVPRVEFVTAFRTPGHRN